MKKLNMFLLIGSILFAGCVNTKTNEIITPQETYNNITYDEPIVTSPITESNVKEWKNLINSGDELFDEKTRFVAIEINRSGDSISDFISDGAYNSLVLYDFGNNLDYTTEIVFIPKDENTFLELVALKINDNGNLEVEQILDSGINEPFKFRYDDFESIIPQYGIIIENSPSSEIIPIVHSGMDGSLAMNSEYSKVIDF